jgi:hypothetical protein
MLAARVLKIIIVIDELPPPVKLTATIYF